MSDHLTSDQLFEMIMRLPLADQLRLIERVTAHALGQLATPSTKDNGYNNSVDELLAWPTTRTHPHSSSITTFTSTADSESAPASNGTLSQRGASA